ncbi:MAG: flagellar biosynthetic protein FliO, partial [Phycisphaerales bacterium]|nr:flagellar biosynthetic protein FliO [Phycisphaerales bacterium]
GRPPAPKTAAASRSDASAAAPALTQSSILRTALSLGVVLALIGVCAMALRALKRRGVLVGGSIAAGARAPSGLLETLGRYPLGRGQTLLLIKLDQRVLLIGQTAGTLRAGGGSLSTLCELSDPEDVASILLKAQDASDASAAARFEGMLREFDDRHGPREPAFETPASVALRPARAPADERSDAYAERVDVRNIPLVPVHTERRSQPQPPAASQHAQPSESFGSLRERLSALRGEAHR